MKIDCTVNNEARQELVGVTKNLREKDVASVVFNARWKIVPAGEARTRFVLELEPSFPALYKLGWVFLVAAFILHGFVGWWSLVFYMPGFVLSATQVFYSKRFYSFLFWLKLRRYGVKFAW